MPGMASHEPPVIVFGFQTVRRIAGNYADFFQPAQQVVVLNANRLADPVQAEIDVVPPNVFVQDNDLAKGG